MTATALHTVPSLSVRLGGTEVGANEITGCRLTQGCTLPDQVELTFSEAAPSTAQPRAELEIGLVGRGLFFVGTITAVTHSLTADGAAFVHVRGYDRLQQLRRLSAVRSWHDVTLHDVAARFAERLGGTACSAPGADLHGVQIPHIIQSGQSDLEFLARLSARNGLAFRMVGADLQFYPNERGADEPIELQWGEHLREAVIDDNLDTAAQPVHVGSQDLTQVRSHTATTGSDAGSTRHLVGVAELTPSDANRLAEVEVARQAAVATRARGVADGDLRLRPGAVVTLRGPGLPDRSVVLTRAEHELDDLTGFSTRFDSEPVEPPAPAAGTVLSLATVSAVAEAEGNGRVQVTLDAYDGVETGFLPVLTAAAGRGGLVAMPEIGARVVVLSDPLAVGHGIVLGGLFPDRLPEIARAGDRTHGAVWTTPAGQRIEMDDVDHTLVVTDTDGSRLEFAPGVVRLHAAGDLELAAPGHGVRITASSVDFVRG